MHGYLHEEKLTTHHYYHLITNKNTYIKIHKKSAIMDTLIKSLLKHRMLTTKLVDIYNEVIPKIQCNFHILNIDILITMDRLKTRNLQL